MKNTVAQGALMMLAILVGGVAAVRMDAAPATDRASGTPGVTQDIVTTAVESGHFKTLCKALEAAGLVETLKGKGPYTVFAPTEEAFAKLPTGVLENLLKPENKEKLKAILLMHVVPADLLIADVKKLKEAKAAGGEKLEVTHHLLTGVHIGTAKHMAHVQNSDIHASNGVIHVIDAVMLP
jgi:uncharacterized surface protein with fasciclin (FAS1) repeats